MEHNTDRILWTVLILAIGVALYVGFRPAANGLLHQSVDKIQTVMTNVKSNTRDSSSDASGVVDASSKSDFSYSDPNTADNTISITGYTGKSANIIIPAYRKIGSVNYKVTAIGVEAFNENKNIKRVTIPDSVTSIGGWAFTGCTSLTSVDIPDSVTSIGDYAFYNAKLTSVDIPDSVTSISSGAFRDTELTSVNLPANLTSIGDSAFYNTPVSTISFKSPVALGEGAFGYTDLTNVTLPTGSTYNTDGNYPTFSNRVNSHVTVTVK